MYTMEGQEQHCPQQDHCLLNGDKHILFEKYEMGKFLGQGTFAKVYKAKNLVTQESVAIKVIHKDHIKEEALIEQIKREISVMHLVKHPNIVELKEVMATKSKIYFVMEYVKGGDLFSKIIKGKLKEDLARKYFQQLINAVDYCHSRGVSHRDLKLENLLLDEEENLKVSDFGLSALPEQHWNDGLLHTQCGTPAYIAPEVLRKKGYDGAEADIWSCGVILFVLLAGRLPFQDENITKMYMKICKAEYVFPPWISPEAKKLISKLLIVDPGKRITFPQIMRNSWFRKDLIPRACSSHSSDSEDNNNMDSYSGSSNHQHHSPPFCNAFELISSMSSGCNLSSLFEEQKKRGSVFTSKCPAPEIVSKLDSVAKELNFEAVNKTEFKMKIQGKVDGRKGKLAVMAEVLEVAPELALVELSKCSGDTLEYAKFCEEEVRPALKDIVWIWQGETTTSSSSSGNSSQVGSTN